MLSPLLPCAIPEPLGRGRPTAEYPFHWGVYRWLEGENPVAGDLGSGPGVGLSIALVALPYYQDTNPELAENARHAIREVLADVSASSTAPVPA